MSVTLRATLRRVFGPNWALFLVLLILIIFWPVAVWYGDIAFSPHEFVEEWLKGGVQGLVVIAVIHAFQVQREAAEHASAAHSHLHERLLSALDLIVEDLEAYRRSLEKNTRPLVDAATGTDLLSRITRELGDPPPHSLFLPREWQALSDAFDAQRCQRLLSSLCPGGTYTVAPPSGALAELLSRLRTLRESLRGRALARLPQDS